MQVKQIEIEYGLTVNLGNYSNAKPVVRVTAELDENDDPDLSLESLISLARRRVQEMADDELEQSGNEVKYSDEPLYQVRYSELRECVVIAPAAMKLPQEKNWKESDDWQRGNRSYPSQMRYTTAVKPASEIANSRYFELIAIHSPHELGRIPPLPDPGPEPQWSKKNLRRWFVNLGIPESQWEEYAALGHFNEAFLESVSRWCSDWENRRKYVISDAVTTILRTGVFPDTPTPDDGDSSYPRGDEGWGDDTEDEDEDEE